MSLLRLGSLRAVTLRRALSTTPRALSKNRPNADAPVNEGETANVDPAARGVNEMRRQWGGLIDDAESQLADEAAASKGKASKKPELKVDMKLHEGLEAEETGDVDPAARGVSEMRKQWGDLIDKK